MALGRNHRIFNIGNSSGSYGISRVYHDETLSGDGTLSSLLGVVGGAGDTEVNEFVYNNSGDIIDVNDVVQSNSGEWGNGGESYSALTSNSANWNDVSSKLDASAFDPNEFYPMTGNPSGFLTAVDLTNYYTKNETSGADELANAFANIPAGDEEVNTYVQNNSATINEVNTTYQQNSANYLTAHQSLDGYATTAWVDEQGYLTAHQDISNKLDVSAFTAWSASQEDNNYELSAGDGISLYDDDINKITRIDVTAQGGNPDLSAYTNSSFNLTYYKTGLSASVFSGVNKDWQPEIIMSGAEMWTPTGNYRASPVIFMNDQCIDVNFIRESKDVNDAVTSNSASWGNGFDPSYISGAIDNKVDLSAYNELKTSYDALSSLFATYSGQWLLPNSGV